MRRFIALAFVVLAAAAPAGQQATQPRPDEAAVIEQLKNSIRFENDGTGRRELYMRIKAQSEAGVQQWGQVVLGYNAAMERLEIPLIRVRKPDGTLVETPPQAIQDLSSPVERIAPVYTDFRQKHVTVQSFRPGDTLEVRVLTTVHTALAPGQFWSEYGFEEDAIVLDEQLDIDVPADRRVILKLGPGFDPVVKDAAGRRTYHWSRAHTVRKEEPDATAKAEKKNPADEPERAPVRLTTFADWKEVGTWFAGLERTARKVTPEIQDKARTLTAGRTSDVEKLEALYDFVSKDFRYVSLSLGAGRYQPRAAVDVLRDAYGDCKDKHTLLAALIDAAGLQASAVLINSSIKLDPDFPSPSQFDHVITRARAGGQDVWLDSTPEVAPFRLLSYGLRKKQALVTEAGQGSHLEETPANPPMPSLVATEVEATLNDTGTLAADVRLTFRGDLELLLRSGFRATPSPQWKNIVEGMAKNANLDGIVSNLKISDPQATRENFTVAFHVEAARYADLAGKKSDLRLPMRGNEKQPDVPEAGPIALGAPGEVSYKLKLTVPSLAKLRAPVPVNVSRDYGEYRATYALTPGLLTMERLLTLRERELPEARRSDYLAFSRVLTSDAQQALSLDGTAIAAAPLSADAKAKELVRTGYDALQAGDYDRAATLLRRAIEADPKEPTARVSLARALLELRQPEAALEALQKQIEVNPYYEYAYFYMGRAYTAQRKYAEAEAAYKKELEINPLDKYAPAALGALYMDRRQYEKAAEAYEKAAAVNPDQVSPHVQLGKAYLNLQRNPEAMAAFDRAVELSPTPWTWNAVAYELSLAAVDLDRAQRYVESAISSTAAVSRNLDIEHADSRALGIAGTLAAYWDTLGWVYFAKRDFAKAERYVARAWAVSQHAEVGDHLGQIYEKLGRRDAAINVYAAALSADAPADLVREHLARAAGGSGKVDALVAGVRADLSRARTFPLPVKGPAGKKGDFLVLFSAPGRVEGVRFVEGDGEMRVLAPVLQKLPAEAVFPDDTPAKILRRGIAACGPSGLCSFTLLLPQDAKPVK